MNLNDYMEQGISLLVKTAGRYYFKNPRGVAFLTRSAVEIKKAAQRRHIQEQSGLHVPPFLIASIASQCNLHCAGCYSRASGGCSRHVDPDLTTFEWSSIFSQSRDLGVTFILLAGGEPLMRRDIIEAAASFPQIIFPLFTNGTMIDEKYLRLFSTHRNLIPVFSIEGDEARTDTRRGKGSYQISTHAMHEMKSRNLLFGCSITVTRENMPEVTAPGFIEQLRQSGCGIVFYVEYVPIEAGTETLMLQDTDLVVLKNCVSSLRDQFTDTIIVSFPGDEEDTDGCLASGRGFFHINAQGGAEPCPFSPYSSQTLKESTVADVLRSGFFSELRKIAAETPHHGGCTLFARKDDVAALFSSHTD